MDTLSKLFGTELRVKLMRLFLFNPGAIFALEDMEKKGQAKKREVIKEIEFLKKLGIVKVVKKKQGRKVERFYSLEQKFQFVDALSDFLVRTHSLEHRAIVKKIEKTGRIKAVIISGIFTRDLESRLDMFVVGDGVKSSTFDRLVKNIESEMGKDIRYALISGPDFAYRTSMNDKLIRDVFDYPHTVLLDKLGIVKS